MWPQRKRCSGRKPFGQLSLPVVFFALAGLSHSVQALDMKLLTVEGQAVLLLQDSPTTKEQPRGGFLPGDVQRFEKVLRESPRVREVWFNSGGGSASEGLLIGRAIRKAGISTRIPRGAKCASACADAFMGGVARRVDEDLGYGIHMATSSRDPAARHRVVQQVEAALSSYDPQKRNIDWKPIEKVIMHFEQGAAREAAKWGAFVLEMGGSPRIVDLGTSTDANSMNWLTRRQMIDLNVINVEN